jgi:hypothetical protein
MTNELEDFVAAFESARAVSDDADLSAFLPSQGHPLYRAVLVELIRIDLEHGWRVGRHLRLEEYQHRFPQIATDADAWQQIAFEDYRLRRQAGEQPSALEYQRRFGVNIGGWPASEAIGGDGAAEMPATCVVADPPGPASIFSAARSSIPSALHRRPSLRAEQAKLALLGDGHSCPVLAHSYFW